MTAATKEKFPGDDFWTITGPDGVRWHARRRPVRPFWEAIRVSNADETVPRDIGRWSLPALVKAIRDLKKV